jgi:putative tryptophan/tyrosine transport system substrate-binding protein
MNRREVITILGGAAAAWPLAVYGQQAMPVIGFLVGGTPSSHGHLVAAFAKRLHELGWIEGRTVAIEIRWAEGRTERYPEIAAELGVLKIDVIVSPGLGVPAAKQAAPTSPIVFVGASDPVGTGLVANLARPDGNVTGLSFQQTDLAGKRLELLREVVPGLRHLAIVGNAKAPGAVREMGVVQASARPQGLEVSTSEIRRVEDFTDVFHDLKGRADALYVCTDGLITTNSIQFNNLALAARLPTIYVFREDVAAGGLMSYGPNFPDVYRRAADYVDKILRGTKPADIPVEQPTKFELIINLITARALGLTVSPTLLARANEVIE